MSNVLSKLAKKEFPSLFHTFTQVKLAIKNGEDLLGILPTEIRLKIFGSLLNLSPKIVFRGAKNFCPLDKTEFESEITVPWQILATSHQYHDEAAPILYGKNEFVFCTGPAGTAGTLEHSPISPFNLHFVKDLRIYFQADDPKKDTAKKVAKFLRHVIYYTKDLDHLTILAASDRFYDAKCPWDVLWNDHPVCKMIVRLIELKAVKHLKLRFHDGAVLYQEFGKFLNHHFYAVGDTEGRSITFTRSCTCPIEEFNARMDMTVCAICSHPAVTEDRKPIEEWCHPASIEADQERTMDHQQELLDLGLFD